MIVKKVCMLGDPSVGKTSLVRRFVYNEYSDRYLSTLGTKVSEKKVELDTEVLQMIIWDIAGQEDFTSVTPAYFKGSGGGILVVDITRKSTLSNAFRWANSFIEKAGNVPLIMFCNKNDLKDAMEFTVEEARDVGKDYCATVLSTSAKTGEGVEKGFKLLAQMMAGG